MLEREDGTYVPVIVTNKHVVEGGVEGKIVVHLSTEAETPSGLHQEVIIKNFENVWVNHPDDDVDLCVMAISELADALSQRGHKPFFIPMNKDIIPSDEELHELRAIEDIVMVGYPNGIWDSVNNLPIMRRGITATHPAYNYEGREEFLIDAACFPGSSGSPVVLLNEGDYSDKLGNTYLGTRGRVLLLGVLYAGPQFTSHGEVQIVQVPTNQQVISVSRNMLNLGNIIKAKRILEIENLIKEMIHETP